MISPTNNATAEQELEDVRDLARIETTTRFNTALLYVLLAQGACVLICVVAILAILAHSLILPLPGGP